MDFLANKRNDGNGKADFIFLNTRHVFPIKAPIWTPLSTFITWLLRHRREIRARQRPNLLFTGGAVNPVAPFDLKDGLVS